MLRVYVSGFYNYNSDNGFHFAIHVNSRFSVLGDECAPLDLEDANPYDASMDS